jgi:hypothetical protein
MSIEKVPGTDLEYYLIAFDAEGRERTNDPDGQMSRRALDALTPEVTDVFLISHGWKGDVPAARDQYNRWIAAMANCEADIQHLRQSRPFVPLLIGLHWPSQPWGDEELGGGTGAFDAPATPPPSAEEMIERYAERIADTPAAREALGTIFDAARQDIAPDTLPPEVRAAYEVLNREAGLGSQGEGGAPGDDREPFDPELSFQAAKEEEAVSFGGFSFGGLLSPLRQLSFWKMKDRARKFGESGGSQLLADLQGVRDGVRFHLMGHSFGCIVVSATIADPPGMSRLRRPVDSAFLVQGALSLWSYCSDIPPAPGQPGYFHSLIAGHKVRGPLVTTQSEFDTAVGRFYPLGAGARGQVVFAPGEFPKYGGLGAFGVRGLGPEVVDLRMKPADELYPFEPGKIYNLESSRFIREGSGASGAHSDIAKPEVAHAFWEAVRLAG